MEPSTKHFLVGFAAGVTTAVVLPVLAPVFSESGRPIAKAVLKRSILTLERMRSSALRAVEAVEDLVAEVRAEVDKELAGTPSAHANELSDSSVAHSEFAAAGARWYAAAAAGFKSRMAS